MSRELLSGEPLDRYSLSRRGFLRLTTSAATGLTVGNLAPQVWAKATPETAKAKRCILLFMGGGASQLESFDPKPGTEIGGPHKVIDTSAKGVKINEHFPHLAKQMHHMSVIRSMDTKEGNHDRAVYLMQTGFKREPNMIHPAFGATVSRQIGLAGFALPHFVAINHQIGHHLQGPLPSGGYHGIKHAPYLIDDINNPVANISTFGGIDQANLDTRLALREMMDGEFDGKTGSTRGSDNRALYRRMIKMMQSPLSKAFDLNQEKKDVRERYGDTPSGKCLLLARRLVESGVSFVEVLLNGWDTHANNFGRHKELNTAIDKPWATLIADLHERGMLKDTMVIWMSEFGRTPKINAGNGRDHWTAGWSIALAGGGFRDSGFMYGSTDAKGKVKDQPVGVEDFYMTVAQLMGMDPAETYYTSTGRPVTAVEGKGRVVEGILA